MDPRHWFIQLSPPTIKSSLVSNIEDQIIIFDLLNAYRALFLKRSRPIRLPAQYIPTDIYSNLVQTLQERRLIPFHRTVQVR